MKYSLIEKLRSWIYENVKPQEDIIKVCTREQPHDGPCNGWPCAYVEGRLSKVVRVGFEDWKVPA